MDVIQRCVPAWQRPPGLDRYRAELEIRVRAVDGGYRVEDVLVLDSNISDPDLEACLREAYVGVAIAMSGPAPAPGARIVFPVVIHFRHPR